MAGELLKEAFFGSKAKVDDITKQADFEGSGGRLFAEGAGQSG